MKCPYCGNPDTRVIDSRPAEDKSSIRRRRSCDECGKRFTTYEKVETIPLIVIKKDNNREQYERAKIENGVLSACYKRPVPAQEIQKTIDAIELEIFAELNPPKRVNRPEACGLRHLAFRVDDVETTVAELAQMGIECEPIRLDSYTQKKMTFFFDPDGLPLELHE